jgi:hypothetical protein
LQHVDVLHDISLHHEYELPRDLLTVDVASPIHSFTAHHEEAGLDISEHGENAMDFSEHGAKAIAIPAVKMTNGNGESQQAYGYYSQQAPAPAPFDPRFLPPATG